MSRGYLMTTPATAREAEDIRGRLAALGTVDEIVIYDLVILPGRALWREFGVAMGNIASSCRLARPGLRTGKGIP
jgi:hypothetical protein